MPAEVYNSLLPSLIMRKLPNELCLSISKKLSEVDWKLDSTMDELSKELEEQWQKEVRLNLSVTIRGQAQLLCFQGISIVVLWSVAFAYDSCREVTDLKARKKLLKEAGRCFFCLKKGHMSRKCIRWCARCSNCGGHDHKSIFALNQNDKVMNSQCERSLNPKVKSIVDHDSMCCCKQQELIVLI